MLLLQWPPRKCAAARHIRCVCRYGLAEQRNRQRCAATSYKQGIVEWLLRHHAPARCAAPTRSKSGFNGLEKSTRPAIAADLSLALEGERPAASAAPQHVRGRFPLIFRSLLQTVSGRPITSRVVRLPVARVRESAPVLAFACADSTRDRRLTAFEGTAQ